MIFISLSILFNAYVGIIFKYFGKWKVDARIAIVVNYFVCIITGCFMMGEHPYTTSILSSDWVPWSIGLAFLLFSMFSIMSIASVQIGITLTQAANKMSLAIPVFFSLYLYNESLNVLKIAGILTALVAVYLITTSKKEKSPTKNTQWWLLPILFLGSGAIDTLMKFVETHYLSNTQSLNQYLIYCFSSAAILGSAYVSFLLIQKKIKLNKRSLFAGILLGLPNYFSIYFLIKALQFKDLDSSAIIPINNTGILIAVSLFGFLIFREKITLKNKIGLGLAALSILFLLIGR